MGSILEAIEDWFRGLLVSGIMTNLSGTFDSVNAQVADIAHPWMEDVMQILSEIKDLAMRKLAIDQLKCIARIS